MRYEVYLDSYFWLNFTLNCFILYLTGKLLGLRIIYRHLLMGALLAGILSCIGILLPMPGGMKLSLWQLGSSALAVQAAYRIRKKKTLCYALFFQFGAGSMLSGLVSWTGSLLTVCFGRRVSPLLLLCAAAGISALTGCVIRSVRREKKLRLYEVGLEENGQTIQVTALLDTGNSLREPFTGKPVCIIERQALEQIANEDYCRENPQKNRIIPYHSIGRQHGLMKGLCISRMWIDTQTGRIDLTDVVIAASENEITGNGQYQMILHPSIIGE